MIEFEISNMSCGHCVASIRQAVTALDPAATVQAELAAHRVRIETTRPRAEVEQALRVAGYPPTPVP